MVFFAVCYIIMLLGLNLIFFAGTAGIEILSGMAKMSARSKLWILGVLVAIPFICAVFFIISRAQDKRNFASTVQTYAYRNMAEKIRQPKFDPCFVDQRGLIADLTPSARCSPEFIREQMWESMEASYLKYADRYPGIRLNEDTLLQRTFGGIVRALPKDFPKRK